MGFWWLQTTAQTNLTRLKSVHKTIQGCRAARTSNEVLKGFDEARFLELVIAA